MRGDIILITGASGFVGTNLVQYLLKCGYAVISLDLRPPRWAGGGYHRAASPAAEEGEYDWLDLRGDVRDEALLKTVFRRPVAYAIHLAARSTIQMGAEDEKQTMSVNVEGTECLLRAAAGCPTLKGFFYASTDKVYGLLPGRAYTETDALAPLDSPYDRSKAAAEQLVRSWAQEGKIPGVILRFCNLYGPYDLQNTRVIPRNIQAILQNRPCTLRVYRDADGGVRDFQRDFLYVGDLCEAVWKLLQAIERREQPFPMTGEAFNLGAPNGYPISQVIHTIQKLLCAGGAPVIEEAEGLVEIPEQRMDSSKAAAAFGYAPRTPLEGGLTATIQWWLQYLDGREDRITFSREEAL